MTADSSPEGRLDRALASLRGLAVGDALGSQFFVPVNYPLLKRRELPSGPWQWTDDTEMACSVVAVLAAHHRIDQDALARSFAEHHDFDRGYGPAVNRLLRLVREGGDWRELSAALFNGQGSWGNGAAMRIAPSAPGTRTIRSRRPTRPRSRPTPRINTARPSSARWPSLPPRHWPPPLVARRALNRSSTTSSLSSRRARSEQACGAPGTCWTTRTRPLSLLSWVAGGVRRPMTRCPSRSGLRRGPSVTMSGPSGQPLRSAVTWTPRAPSWAA